MKTPKKFNCMRRRQSGSAVMVLLALLGMMVVFMAVNTIAIRSLQREVKLIEKKQVQRLQSATTSSTPSRQ